MANCANITRRSIFKLAPAAVLATGGAVVAFPAKSEPLTLDQEIEASVKRLEELYFRKFPDSVPLERINTCTREGGYLLCLMGNPPAIRWSGDGYYEIFVDYMDKKPTLMWVEQWLGDLDGTPSYRAYARKKNKRTGCFYHYTERSLSIFKKL